jgi:predicted nucleic acid-binding protein
LRTAQQSGCRVLLSEDFQECREIDGIQVVNPFS